MASSKGVRGPRGGYELARERRRITAGDIVRDRHVGGGRGTRDRCRIRVLVERVVGPLVARGTAAFLSELDGVTVDDLCARAQATGAADERSDGRFHNLICEFI